MSDPFRFSFSTISYSSFPVWLPAYPLEDTISRLAAMGYDAIEILAAAPHAYPPYVTSERRESIGRALESSGLAVSAMLPAPGGAAGNNPASADPGERAYALSQYEGMMELCAAWGCGTVIYVPGWYIFGTSRADAWRWSLEALAQIAEKAAAHGLQVVVEPTPGDFNLVETADNAIEMMRAVDANNVKLMFDTFHALYRNEVPSDWAYVMGSDLEYVHISDNDRLVPGQGRGDFPGLLAALSDIGYSGYLSMELGFTSRGAQPDQVARDSLAYMRGLMAEMPAMAASAGGG
jgi:fructoselysine 3-epimerase